MLKANAKLREQLRKAKIPLWEIGTHAGVHEKTICSWMRFELCGEREKRVLAAVEQIKAERVKLTAQE